MNPYAHNKQKRDDTVRVVVDLKDELVDEVDAWGVPAGMRSRADSIRNLLRSGLDVETETTAQK